jgi:hypothetical protein
MRIRIGKVTCEHFKGLANKTVDFKYRNALVRAENGTGKTSLADGVFWVLYDKNSAGEKKFGIRPIDTNPKSPHFEEPIRGLVVKVVVELLIDGFVKAFRKEQHEVVKEVDGERRYSYPNKYWIDDYPLPEGEYKKAIEDIIPTETFKMLTDIDHFNNDEKTKWPNRREVLRDMAGNIPQPSGHEDLLVKLNGHEVDAYRKTLTDRKKLLVDEQYDNGICIGEKQRDLKNYVQGDNTGDLEAQRDNITESIAELGRKRSDLLGKEKERQGMIDKVNKLTNCRGQRESQILCDTNSQQALFDERAALEQAHSDKTQALVTFQNGIRSANTNVEVLQDTIARQLSILTGIKDEYKKAKAKPADETCYACGQRLPADQIADAENKRQTALGNIEARGNRIKETIDDYKSELAEKQDARAVLVAKSNALVEELKIAQVAKDKRIAEISKAIKNRPEPDYAADIQWQNFTAEIEKLVAQIGEPVTTQLEAIESRKQTAEAELAKVNESLAASDAIKRAGERIAELEDRQKVVAQLICDVNAELDEISRYKVEQSKMIEAVVNGMFEHVTWRLFEYHLNGEINDQICVCLLDGKPYPGLSKGEKVFANNDVINTLGDYYGVEVFRFVDDTGDVTLPIEANSQVIELAAVVGVKELEVSLEEINETEEQKVERKVVA